MSYPACVRPSGSSSFRLPEPRAHARVFPAEPYISPMKYGICNLHWPTSRIVHSRRHASPRVRNSSRAPGSGPALNMHGTKAPGVALQDPATRRYRWRQAVPGFKLGMGGTPRPLSLHCVTRRCSARSVAEAALSLSVRASASTACTNVKASIIPPTQHNSCPADQSQECLRAVRRQFPRPLCAPLEIGVHRLLAAANNAPDSQASRWQLLKGSNGRGQAAECLHNPPCRELGKHASQTLPSYPAATILQCEAGHQRQKHVSADCPLVASIVTLRDSHLQKGALNTVGVTPITGAGPPRQHRRDRGLLQRGYDLFIMHINHYLMNSGGTDLFNSTLIARLRPDAHPTKIAHRIGAQGLRGQDLHCEKRGDFFH